MRLYEEIVGRGGMSPSHFFYNMTLGECAAYIRGMQRKERERWEQTRMIMYAVVQSNSTKELDPEDVMKFAWDKESPAMSEEERMQRRLDEERELSELRERAKKMRL